MARTSHSLLVWARGFLGMLLAWAATAPARGVAFPGGRAPDGERAARKVQPFGAARRHIEGLLARGDSCVSSYRHREGVALCEEAVAASARLLGLSREPADANLLARSRLFAAAANLLLGRLGRAMDHYDQGALLTSGMADDGAVALYGTIRLQQARLTLFLGDHAAAHRHLDEAEKAIDRRLSADLVKSLVGGGLLTRAAAVFPYDMSVSRLDLLTLRAEVHMGERNLSQAAGLLGRVASLREHAYRASKSRGDGVVWAEALRLKAAAGFSDKRDCGSAISMDQALETFDAVVGDDKGVEAERAAFLSDVGCIALRLGNLAKAVERLRAAKAIIDLLPEPFGRYRRWTVDTNLAVALSVGGGDIGEAVRLLNRTLDSQEKVAKEAFPLLTTPQRWRYLTYHNWALGAYLSAATRAGTSPAEMYDRVLKFKAASFIGEIRERAARAGPYAAASAALGAGHLKGPFGGPGASAAIALNLVGWTTVVQDQMADWAEELVALQRSPDVSAAKDERTAELKELLDRYGRYLAAVAGEAGPADPLAVTAGKVAKALPEDAVFVDWVEADIVVVQPRIGKSEVGTERRLVGFVVFPGGKVAVVAYPTPMGRVAEMAQEWLGDLNHAADVSQVNDKGRKVAELVWRPISRQLPPGKVRRLLLAPDGDLWGLPFAALPVGGKPNRYLVQDYWIGMVMSGHQLLRPVHPAIAPQPAGRKVLLVGNVAYPNKEDWRDMSDLTNWIASFIGKADGTYLERDEATRKNVFQAMACPHENILLAGHVRGGPAGPSLTPAQFGLGVAIQKHHVSAHFPLAHSAPGVSGNLLPEHFRTHLVCRARTLGVIGCHGGRGVVIPGEGIIGFPRAALTAGVETVWTTLWDVDPLFAAPFARGVLEGYLKGGLPLADALWKEQNRRLKSGGVWAHPTCWAGWVAIGYHDLKAKLPEK